MKDHLADSCPEKVIPCRQAGNGCTWEGRRILLEAHVDKCPYESIKGFFAIHSAQVARISKDNDRLRRRTDELEGTVRILRQELEWAKIALGPWYRPVYPERQSTSTNYTRHPNSGGTDTRPGPSQFGAILLQGVDPTGGTSHQEHRVESGAAETYDFFDPFSFISQRQDHISGVHVPTDASATTNVAGTDTNPNISSNAGNHAIESRDVHDLDRDATFESGPSGFGSSDGSGSIHNATVTALSSGASNLQSTSVVPPVALFSDHFPSADGSSSRTQGWQHVSSGPVSTPPVHGAGMYSPVSITVPATRMGLHTRKNRD